MLTTIRKYLCYDINMLTGFHMFYIRKSLTLQQKPIFFSFLHCTCYFLTKRFVCQIIDHCIITNHRHYFFSPIAILFYFSKKTRRDENATGFFLFLNDYFCIVCSKVKSTKTITLIFFALFKTLCHHYHVLMHKYNNTWILRKIIIVHIMTSRNQRSWNNHATN